MTAAKMRNIGPKSAAWLRQVGLRTKVDGSDVIKTAAQFLRQGKILALRGLGGFQLACNATDDNVINALRRRKHRPGKPFAVMLLNIEDVKRHCVITYRRNVSAGISGKPDRAGKMGTQPIRDIRSGSTRTQVSWRNVTLYPAPPPPAQRSRHAPGDDEWQLE